METQKQSKFEELIDDYFQTLNELDEKRRIELIQKVWAADGTFVSPIGKAQGYAENNNLIWKFYQQSPGIKISRTGFIETLHENYLLFGFEAVQPDGATLFSGVDFAVINNGKLQLVAGFFKPLPHNGTNSTRHQNINVVKQMYKKMYKAFNTGEYATLLEFFAPTIEWYAADNSPLADQSPYRGLDAVLEHVFPRIAAKFPGMQVRIDEIYAIEDKVVMLGYYRDIPQTEGGKTEAQVAHIWTFEGGKAVKFQQYLDTYKFAAL